MDYDKLIEQYRQAADEWEKRHPVTDTFDLRVQDALIDAAIAIETLRAENEKLRAELESKEKYYEQMIDALSATDSVDLARVTAERDAAVSDISSVLAEVEEIRRGYGVDNADADRKKRWARIHYWLSRFCTP